MTLNCKNNNIYVLFSILFFRMFMTETIKYFVHFENNIFEYYLLFIFIVLL